VREKQKKLQQGVESVPGTPGSPAAGPGEAAVKTGSTKWQAGATQRKCANCGQVGHIKTNKKLCPLYKDGKLPEFDNAAFGGSTQTNGDGSTQVQVPPA
jgi:transcription initiation factor TFIID subunit 1, fungi type